MIKVGNYFADNPKIAVDVSTSVVGLYISYVGLVSATTLPGIAIGVVGLSCSVWGTSRTFEGFVKELFGEEPEDESK